MKPMKQIKRMFLNVIICYYILAITPFCNNPLFATGYPPTPVGTASCAILATSAHHTSGPSTVGNPNGPYIFDDGYSNYFDGTAGGWNCNRRFLFMEYTNQDISFDFAYGGEYTNSLGVVVAPVTSHDIKVYNNITNVLVHTFLNYPDKTTSGDDNPFILTSPYNATPGEYRIEYWRDDATALHPKIYPDIIGIFVLSPQIEKLWIDVSPICSDFSATQYNFQVHAYPDFSSIIQYSAVYYKAPDCDHDEPVNESFLKFDFSSSSCKIYHSTWPAPYGITDEIVGSSWVSAYPDVNNYYITNRDYTDILDLASYLNTMGGNYHTTPIINVSFYDGITTMTATAPIIIESSVSSLTAGASSPTPSYAVPGMAGTPDPSFDMYNYNVTGVETWTPTNNPIVTIHGQGNTTSTIRIQHDITIQPGGGLTLQNMTCEMGPAATVTALPPSTSATNGGVLVLDHSTLTAYRGCDVASSPPTDNSTWSGVTAVGNPAFPQGVGSAIHPQGMFYMNSSEISYADVGVQNGYAASTSGGIIMTYLGTGSLFYNNKLAVNFWPYHSYISGVEQNNIDRLQGATFKNDGASWFPLYNFIQAVDIKGVFIYSNHFINATGTPGRAAIAGYNAAMRIDNNDISNFNTGAFNWGVSGTYGVSVTGNTFSRNQFGFGDIGGIATDVSGNTFNIPAWSGTYLTDYYPGTTVLIVNDQHIGALLMGTAAYNVTNNIFQTDATVSPATPGGYYERTTGTLQHNTGSALNQVTGNTFHGLRIAMNSNFANNNAGGLSGLQYLCNTDTHVGCDISVVGGGGGGIKKIQGTSTSSGTYDRSAGNIFGSLMNIWDDEQAIIYNYSSAPGEYPANIHGSVTRTSAPGAYCFTVGGPGPFSVASATGYALGSAYGASSDDVTGDASFKYAVASANVNYYMMDTTGEPHRDSLYYWARQMGSPDGDLLLTNLFIEDSVIDSANAVYDNIITKYSLAGQEANDYTQGRYLMDMLIYKRQYGGSFQLLSASQVGTLQSVKANATMWAHARAENWLYMATGEALVDTLLMPDADFDTVGSGGGGGKASPHTQKPVATPEITNMVFPNPVHDYLQVVYTAKTDEDITMQIEDISGRNLITQSLVSGVQTAIDMSKLAPGFYLYRILEGSKLTMIGKITKD